MDEITSRQYDQAMALAIAEARKGAGFVSPNPLVGCVILDVNGNLIAKGYHKKFGDHHAEIDALKGLSSEQLKGSTVFVTLEPCAHQGKTPSCAKALALLPIKKVIYGLVDPNPLVSGQGALILENAGISAELYNGELVSELEEVCEHFLVNYKEKRPFISLKVASSLDGQMALASGESKWITGIESREYAHFLRATHEAVLVGQRTLEIDNPSLDIRHPNFPEKRNQVIVLLSSNYSHLRPRELNVLKVHTEAEVHFFEKIESGYVRLKLGSSGELGRTSDQPELNLNFTQSASGSTFFSAILIEGGAQVLSSHISGFKADRLYLFQAPIILGAKGGKAWSEQVIIKSMGDRISLKNPKVRQLGNDFLITAKFEGNNSRPELNL